MSRQTTIELAKEYLKFSAAHFTIFSATDRERLHGHNFTVSAKLRAPVDDNGLCFDYAIFKQHLKQLCESLDEYTLIAEHSKHLKIEKDGDYYRVVFNGEAMIFLRSDTLLLPVRNTTVEELSDYLINRILADEPLLKNHNIQKIEISVSSGPGQQGSSCWDAGD
jgi:6-pyruvoyltetrahydropterin/6-carboxytetrahydropterin synthase